MAPELQRKIALMGFPGVGKSSLTQRFVSGNFPKSYDATIEDYYTKDSFPFNGQKFCLQLVDTAGQNEYSLFPRSCTVDVDGFVLVCAINSSSSLAVLQAIHDKILDNIGGEEIPIVVVCNKQDLPPTEREVVAQDLSRLRADWKCPVIETSAYENRKVEEIFSTILRLIEIQRGNLKPSRNDSCAIS